ncbi:MAG TPA: alginate lyase family protein [Acidobacteriaceae bacterium]|nr:alginate lyase family protein [Acidobacteriaceae bacterium]
MKPRPALSCAALLVASIAAPLAARAAEPLHSPWDAQHIALTDTAYTCPDPPPFAKTLDAHSYYTDAHHSVIDPKLQEEERRATEAPTHLGQWSTEAADKFLETGSRAAAACVYSLLNAAAQAKAWTDSMPTGQGHYEQKWLLAATSVAYLKVRNTGVGTPGQEKDIKKWFSSLANRVTDYVDSRQNIPGSDAQNNHRYWSGLAVSAAGIALNDKSDYEWGIASYKFGVDQIQPNGVLPLEMNRAGRALHYHLYALAPLIMIAELAEANGLDLYSYDSGAIHRLVKLCIAGLADPSLFAKATGVPQDITGPPYSGADIGWAVPYVRRFPNAQLSQWIAQAEYTRFWQWGGLPPGANL